MCVCIVLTECGVVEFGLVHLTSECPEFAELLFLRLDPVPEPAEPLVLRRHLMVLGVVLFQVPEPLLFGRQQLPLRLDLVLLPARHLLQLPDRQFCA